MRWRKKAVVILLMLAILTYVCSKEDIIEWPPGFVVGTVIDKDSGTSIDSVIISATLGPDTTDSLLPVTMTDTNGYYSFVAGHYEGDVYVLAEKDGFEPEMLDAYLRKDDTVVVNFELKRQ
jgi:hypothetical protein